MKNKASEDHHKLFKTTETEVQQSLKTEA